MKEKNRILYVIGLLAIFGGLFLFSKFSTLEDATWGKLWYLLGLILLASVGISLLFNTKQYCINVARIFSGILFVFSGFVKAVDPLGSKYKFIDYFEAWNMSFLDSYALTFGIILSTIEFVLGLALVFKIFPKTSSLLGLLFMLFFTPVTLYLAFQENISGKELVHDCGCFGDALILTNWQTFVKNLLILIPVGIAFWYRKRIDPVTSQNKSLKLAIVFVLSVLSLSIYALKHLPPIDFRPYKIGTKLVCSKCSDEQIAKNTKTYQYAEFVNNQTGERKEFDIVYNYPDYTIWDYNPDKPIRVVTEKIQLPKDSIRERAFEVDYLLFRKGAEDYTCRIITDTSYVFLLVQYDIQTTNTKNQAHINALYAWTQEKGYAFYGATSSLDEYVDAFREATGAQYLLLDADDIPLKTIVRANPGLVLLKNGVVLKNWHGNDIPSIEEFETFIQ